MGVPVRWEIDEEYPGGHAVPMTVEELAARDALQAADAADASKPAPPTLADRFGAVVDAVLAAPDFDAAKQQIAVLTSKAGKGS